MGSSCIAKISISVLALFGAIEAAAQTAFPAQPAVDGVNAKIAGYGGGASHTDGFYGAAGSLTVPLGPQWGLQVDAGAVSVNGNGAFGGAGHLFWRNPAAGLLGIYGSYARWNGPEVAGLGHLSADVGRFALESEYYRDRWSFTVYAGIETASISAPTLPGLPAFSVPNRFFDSISISYYPIDKLKLSLGQLYTFGRLGLTLGGEYGLPLGGGRMASVFARGLIREGNDAALLAGLRLYLGQRDKSLIDRHRQDDPDTSLDPSSPSLPPPQGACGYMCLCGSGAC